MELQLGDRVRATRKRYGMAMAELARRINISRNQLYMIERNKTADPGAFTVLAIAEVLGVTTDFLLAGKGGGQGSTSPEPTPPQRQRTQKALVGD